MNSPLALPVATPAGYPDQSNAIMPWLHHLKHLYPISNALVIGAGNGADPWVNFLRGNPTDSVTLVEADDACFKQLQRATADHPGWSLCHYVIAPVRGPVSFHRTNVPSENGLLDPRVLVDLWPRIFLRESFEFNAITLADVIDGQHDPVNWLFLDCLPARPMLEGIAGHLAQVKVLVARVTDCVISGDADRATLMELLESQGFQFLVFEPNRNPNTGHALFVRNPAVSIRTAHELRSVVFELQTQLVASEAAREEMQTTISELAILRDSLQQQTEDQRTQLAVSEVARGEMQTTISEMIRIRDSLQQQAGDLRTQLKQRESDKSAAETQMIEIAALLADFQSTISTLEDALTRSGEERASINRKLHVLTSQMSLISKFLYNGKNNSSLMLLMNENNTDQQAIQNAAAAQEAGHLDDALQWLHKTRKAGMGRKKIVHILLDHVLMNISKEPASEVVVPVKHPPALENLSNSLQKIRARCSNLKAAISHDTPARDIILLIDTEISILQYELMLSVERGRVQLETTDQSSNLTLVAKLNERWLEGIRSRAVSQLGQDLWVLERCSYKRNGFFVEFGATDGISLSNTYLMEHEFGWNGICAEPNPNYFAELSRNRICELACECIGGVTGEEVEFVFASEYGGMVRDMDKDNHKDKRKAYVDTGQIGILTTISLHDFLIKHEAPRTIDYLSIDTEGSELSILEAFPFDRWDIRNITVEHNFTEQRSAIRKLLTDIGYQVREAEWDDWYYLEDTDSLEVPRDDGGHDMSPKTADPSNDKTNKNNP